MISIELLLNKSQQFKYKNDNIEFQLNCFFCWTLLSDQCFLALNTFFFFDFFLHFFDFFDFFLQSVLFQGFFCHFFDFLVFFNFFLFFHFFDFLMFLNFFLSFEFFLFCFCFFLFIQFVYLLLLIITFGFSVSRTSEFSLLYSSIVLFRKILLRCGSAMVDFWKQSFGVGLFWF